MLSEFFYLMLIMLFLFGTFAMTGLKMWYIMQQDANLGRKVSGLSIAVGKIQTQLKAGIPTVISKTQGTVMVPAGMENMSLEDAAEMLGFDKKELNNPIFRPIAEKIFEAFKAKAQQGENDEPNIEML